MSEKALSSPDVALPQPFAGALRPYRADVEPARRNPWPKRWLKLTRRFARTIDIAAAHGPMRCLRGDITIAGKYLRTGQWHGTLDATFAALTGAFGAGPFDLVVNVGANNGCTVLPLIAHGFAKRAIAVEPEPDNAALIAHNARAHGFTANIALAPFAVGAETGTLTLEVSPTNKGDHRFGGDGAAPEGWTRRTVAVRRLDDAILPVVADLAPASVLTWMDIQGAEPLAIAGGRRYFEQFPLTISEFNPCAMARLGASRESVFALFSSLWTDLMVSEGDGWTRTPIEALPDLWNRLHETGGEVDVALTRVNR